MEDNHENKRECQDSLSELDSYEAIFEDIISEDDNNECVMIEEKDDEKGEGKNEGAKRVISFDIFSHLNKIYKKYGFYDEDIRRFLLYVKKRRAKLKNKVLFKIKKVGKYVNKIYHTDSLDEEYLELLVLDVELCRCRYVQIKTDMSNLKVSYRSKYTYLRRLKRSVDKITFLNNIINNRVDKNTELQVKCYHAYIECCYLLEIKKFEKCLEKIDEFTKLINLIKKIGINYNIDNKKTESIAKETSEKKLEYVNSSYTNDDNSIANNTVVNNSISNNDNNAEKMLVKKSGVLIDEEKGIEEMHDYFSSVVDSYTRTCAYNIQKINIRNLNNVSQDDANESLNRIVEHDCNTTYKKLDICISTDAIEINVKNIQFKLQYHNNSILKIKDIVEDTKNVLDDNIIKPLNVDYNLRELYKHIHSLFGFLDNYSSNFIIENYGNILSKYIRCISIVHEELIKSANGNNKIANDNNKLMDRVWNTLESYFISEKLYIDIERTLLVLMKDLLYLYRNGDIKKLNFHYKKTFNDALDTTSLLQEGIRYADILKQNTDELQNLDNNDIFINILQIIKNVKSLCLAFYYTLICKNAEAHVLFDLIKTRNYIYIKINNMHIPNNSLYRVSILFNRLQDLVSIINEKYYFRNLSIYALQVKKKATMDKNVFHVDNSLYEQKMSHVCLNPIQIDMAHMIHYSPLIYQESMKKKSPGFRGLLKSIWKK